MILRVLKIYKDLFKSKRDQNQVWVTISVTRTRVHRSHLLRTQCSSSSRNRMGLLACIYGLQLQPGLVTRKASTSLCRRWCRRKRIGVLKITLQMNKMMRWLCLRAEAATSRALIHMTAPTQPTFRVSWRRLCPSYTPMIPHLKLAPELKSW